jgi:hypothetical protein
MRRRSRKASSYPIAAIMFEIRINLQPVLESAVRELKAATDKETEGVLKRFAEFAPAELRSLLEDGPPRSVKGNPPHNDSFELYNSIRAEMAGKKEVVIEFAEHAQYLDPVFGGYLDRPFIERGIESAVKRL